MTADRDDAAERADADHDAPIDGVIAWRRLLDLREAAAVQAAALDALRAADLAAEVGLRCTTGTWGWGSASTPDADGLAALYTPLALAGSPFAFAQLGQSIDGFLATSTGDAVFVTGEDDRRHLHRLRALADAVVVGAATAVADDPALTVRAAPGANPVRVVLDPSGRVPTRQRIFTDAAAPTLWIMRTDAPQHPVAPHVEIVRLDPQTSYAFSPGQILDALARRGLGRVLVEGGGRTVSSFFHGGHLGRLYLTVAPVLIGNGVPGLRFEGTTVMRDALRPPARTFHLGADVLFDLDLSTPVDGRA